MNKILFVTSSFPQGKGESFIEPEIEYLSAHYLLDVLATYPRGSVKVNKPIISGSYIESPLFNYKYFISFISYFLLKPRVFFSLVRSCLVSSWVHSFRNLVLIPKAIFIAQTIMLHKEYQFIYCHWLSAPAQLSLLLSQITTVPYGVTAHRWDIVNNNNLDKKLYFSCFVRVISNHSKSLFSEYLIERHRMKLNRLYLGVKIGKTESRVLQNKICFTGICVASFLEVKGHKYLFRAMKKVIDQGFNVRIKLIGDGPLKNNLMQLAFNLGISNKIEFCGTLEHKEVIELLSSKQGDFSCLPSVNLGEGHHEGVPVAIMEAMSCGLPCISTKTGAISELIEDGSNGFLVEDKNPCLLAEAIIRILTEPNKYKLMSSNAIRTISESFNSEKNNLELLSWINSSIEHCKE